MKVFRKLLLITLTIVVIIVITTFNGFAAIRQFDGSGDVKKLQRPRGYYALLNDGSKVWLASQYTLPIGDKDQSPVYSGDNGLSYIDYNDVAEIRALVSNGVQEAYSFVAGYYKKSANSGLSILSLGTLFPDGTAITTPNDTPNNWCIRFKTLKLEPGTYYEFAYLSGLYANNGGTCVVAENETGFLAFDQGRAFNDPAEANWYESHKYNEYYFPNWSKNADGSYNVSYLPFRYHIQTYADISAWEAEVPKVQAQIDSTGSTRLADILAQYNDRVNNVIRYELQDDADADIKSLIQSIEEEMVRAKTDLATFNMVLKEAKELYSETKSKTGKTVGKYGAAEVENLASVINDAETNVNKNTDQSIVDAYVIKLRQAIEAVKASKVTKGEIRFYDSATGIIVVAEKGSLPAKTVLYVAQVSENESTYKNTVAKQSEEIGGMVIYVIKFLSNNKEVSPSSDLRIQIPVISPLDPLKTSVYHVDGNGDTSVIQSSLSNGTQIFFTSKMGNFGVFEYESGKGNNDANDNEDVMVKTDDYNGNEINDSTKLENNDKITKDRVMQDAEKKGITVGPIDLSELSSDLDEDTVKVVGISVAGFGVLCGAVEFVRSRREKDLFI